MDRLGDNDDTWHYTFGPEENSGWIGHNGQIPGYFTFEVYNPKLDATSVGANERGRRMSFNGADGSSDIEGKAVTGNGEQAGTRASFK